MMDIERAQHWILAGAIAAFGAAAATVGLASWINTAGAPPWLSAGLAAEASNPAIYVLAAMLVAFGGLILRASRVAALLGGAVMVAAFVVLGARQEWSAALVVLLLLFFMVRALKATMAYHRERRDADPTYRGATMWQYALGTPVCAALIAFLGIGTLTEIGLLPPSQAVTDDELSTVHRAYLVNKGFLKKDEKVVLFYSNANWSIAADGNLLTDKRVISWYTDDMGETTVQQIPLDDIDTVHVNTHGGLRDTSVVQVVKFDGTGTQLFMTSGPEGDEKFVNYIRDKQETLWPLMDRGTHR